MTDYPADIHEGPSSPRLATPAGRPARSDLNAPARWRVHRFAFAFSLVVIAVIAAWPYLPRRYVATTSLILHSDRDALPTLTFSMTAPSSRKWTASHLLSWSEELSTVLDLTPIKSFSEQAGLSELGGLWKSWISCRTAFRCCANVKPIP